MPMLVYCYFLSPRQTRIADPMCGFFPHIAFVVGSPPPPAMDNIETEPFIAIFCSTPLPRKVAAQVDIFPLVLS
jgi:hypothetical protein